MPKIGGEEVAHLLRDQMEKKPLLIANSGYCLPADRQSALQAGFDYFLPKPCDYQELLSILEKCVNSQNASPLASVVVA